MNLEYRKLSQVEVESELAQLSGWTLESGQICKTYTFDAYLNGVRFASDVGSIAEERNHHPDILITWCKVRISVSTHDVGGLSPYDFDLARRIDAHISR